MNARSPRESDQCPNETWSTGRAMAYGYDNAHQLTSVAASRPSDAARYRYDAAGNPVDRAELGFAVTREGDEGLAGGPMSTRQDSVGKGGGKIPHAE